MQTADPGGLQESQLHIALGIMQLFTQERTKLHEQTSLQQLTTEVSSSDMNASGGATTLLVDSYMSSSTSQQPIPQPQLPPKVFSHTNMAPQGAYLSTPLIPSLSTSAARRGLHVGMDMDVTSVINNYRLPSPSSRQGVEPAPPPFLSSYPMVMSPVAPGATSGASSPPPSPAAGLSLNPDKLLLHLDDTLAEKSHKRKCPDSRVPLSSPYIIGDVKPNAERVETVSLTNHTNASVPTFYPQRPNHLEYTPLPEPIPAPLLQQPRFHAELKQYSLEQFIMLQALGMYPLSPLRRPLTLSVTLTH